MNKKNLLIVSIVVVIAVLGFAAFRQIAANRAAAVAPKTETAVVTRGDLAVTADASGSLAPRAEIRLAFTSGGRVAKVMAAEDDRVEAGQALARLDDASAKLQLAQAELNLQSAEAKLNDLIASTETDIDPNKITSTYVNLTQARDALADAQANYADVFDPARDWELDIQKLADKLEAERDAAARVLDKAKDALTVAQAQYNLTTSGLKTELTVGQSAITQQQMAVKQAQLSVETARLALSNTVLTTPAAGTVIALQVEPGEIVNTGQTVIVLNDLGNLKVEVNVDETIVAQLGVGMEARISLDAFPNVELAGAVTRIASAATVQSGVVLYRVTVRLDPTDPSTRPSVAGQALPLRSGMTVNVTFPIEKRTDTLLVPFRAVETEGGQAYVTRVTASGSERVAVTLGLITDTQVEILSGLQEGDVVAVYANPVQDTELMKNPMFGGGQ